MREFKTLYVTTEVIEYRPQSIILKLPNNSKILKIENTQSNYNNICYLNILAHVNIDEKDEIDYKIVMFEDGQAIDKSWKYINSFRNSNNFEFHICYLKG